MIHLQKYECRLFYLYYTQLLYSIMNGRQRLRKNQPLHSDEEDLDFTHNFDPNSETKRSEETRTRAAKNAKINYAIDQEDKAENAAHQIPTLAEAEAQYEETYEFLTPKVEFLLWKIDHLDPHKQKYLVKFHKKSYLQTLWMNRDQLKAIGFDVTSNTLKSMKIKIRKTLDLKLKRGQYFNPNFKIPDRILSSTEIFTAIHHKKANDIKGKWDQTILIICQKILNFVKDGYPYGILLHQPYNQQLQKQHGITSPINIGQIISKVYLGYYKNYGQFWNELGRAVNNFLLIYPQSKGDFHVVGKTIFESCVFLYEQWYYLCKQRYLQLKQELLKNKVIPQRMVQQGEEKMEELPPLGLFQHLIPEGSNQTIGQKELIGQEIEGKVQSDEMEVEMPIKQDDQMQQKLEGQVQQKYEQQANHDEVQAKIEKQEVKQSQQVKLQAKMAESQPAKENIPIKKEVKFVTVNLIELFCQTNIFLTEKVVDTPKNEQEFQLVNPGAFSLSWLSQNTELTKQYKFNLLNKNDLKILDLNTETDKLYYIKWKDLSYNEASWQTEKNINCPQKIQEFKIWNKIPVKEVRERFQMHNKIHKFLIDYNEYVGEKKAMTHNGNVSKMQTKMFRLDAATKGAPRQYGDKDIPIFKNYRKLKDFQLQSLNWMIKNWYENRNSILADEMGLGKTIQTIAFLYHLYTYENIIGPFLVLAPLTTLHQWRRQIQEWTSFNCLLYYDEAKGSVRQIIQEYQFFHLHTTKTGDIISSKLPKFNVLLTNYELFLNDFQILYRIPFQHIVLDQAHRMKNKTTKTTVTISKLPCVRKTLLTGTPIQNNTKQLWTLLNFIQPKEFASQDKFLQEYGELSTEQQVKNFKKMLKPYLLRRIKEDVETTIPKLSETIIDVEMSTIQKTYYKGILQKNKSTMLKSLGSANFNSISIQLRKCCNHPYLISAETEAQIKFGSLTEQQQAIRFIKSSGKAILLMKLLQKFKNQRKKVLLFSQFVIMLDLLKPHLQYNGYNCQILKGSQSSTTRHQAITRFNHQETDIFLISTKAGGVGINLVAATEIIIYDSDWNPQNDIQATARAHRIGQKKEVNVYRLITANSYESGMFEMSSKKLGLDKAIFTGDTFKSMGDFDDAQKQLTKAEIELLLKKGVIGFLDNQMREEDYFNQSIEDILEKNARKVEYAISQSAGTTFSKTKFKSQENDIKIDAPDFWEQALKSIETPLDKLVKKKAHLKQYSTIDKQQALLVQTYRIVLDFVKQKTLGTGFNAQDERNLLRFLEAINSERYINRQLRDIADLLSIQITKPSRRFKVKEEDIYAITASNVPIHQVKKQEKIDRNLRLKRLKRHKEEENLGLGPSEDEDSGVQEEPQEQSSSQAMKNQQLQKTDQDYYKLCYICEKPKCSIFCGGICNRPFHKKCFQAYNNKSKEIPLTYQLDEVTMQFEKWQNSKQHDPKCFNCKQKIYKFQCSVCLKEGNYHEEQIQNSKSKKHSKAKKQGAESMQDQNSVFKCSFPGKCNKFYHLSCLFSQTFLGKFSDHGGKIIKDKTGVSKQFRCPAHYCNSCYGVDSKSTKLKSYTCIRCCKTFHDKCLNKDKFKRLGHQHFYICIDHLEKPEDISKINLEIQKFGPTKRDKMEIKRKAKQAKKRKISELNSDENKSQKEITSKEEQRGLRRSKRNKGAQSNQKPSQLKQNEIKRSEKKQRMSQSELMQQQSSKPLRSQSNLRNNQQSSMKSPQDSKNSHSKSKSKKKKSQKQRTPKGQNEKSIKSKSKAKKPKVQDNNQSNKSILKEQSKNESIMQEGNLELKYTDFNLTPIQDFDFLGYKFDWCRYCGSRYANNFEKGPWQDSKICQHHYQQWKKGRLRLQKYKNEPKKPINRSKQNELRFLNQYSKRHQINGVQAVEQLNKKLGIE